MTPKQPKKPAKKNTSNKKAPAKKAKKVTPKAKPSFKPDAKDGDGDGIVQDGTAWARPATATETKQQFASADKLMKTLAQQPSIIRANDVKSLPLRKRMLAWFKISK
jgi:hypothetical protein